MLLRFILLFLFAINLRAETLSLCAYYNWSPWIYAEQGGYDGILIEQLELFREMNPDVVINIVKIENWKRCQLEVEQGNISMILGANKTPERENKYDYLRIPAFINRVSLGAYSLPKHIKPVKSLEQLRTYRLGFARGDSFGEAMDRFVESLPKEKKNITNSIYQSIRMVALGRLDYFFLIDTNYKSTIREYNNKFTPIDPADFVKIYTHERIVPVYIVFGKGSGNFEKYADKWIDAINAYHNKVSIDERIAFHITKSGN